MAFKLNIGKPKEPTKSLAGELKKPTVLEPEAILELKDEQILTVSANNSPLAGQLKTTAVAGQSSLSIKTSPLAAALEKKPAITIDPAKPNTEATGITERVGNEIISTSTIPVVTAKKYSLLAEACDTLDQKTIDQFNTRMQFLEVAFDNDELPDAMKRVLEYCQEHQELRPFLRAEDIALFVRGARKSYARVAEKKSTNRTKKSKSAIMDDNIMESLMDLDIDL